MSENNDIESNINENNNVLSTTNINDFNKNLLLEEKKDNSNPYLILYILLYIILFGLQVTYYVYSIISLCQTSYIEQKESCSKSNMWLYVLINTIISIIVNLNNFQNKLLENSDNIKNKVNYVEILIILGMTVWSCYEFFGINCIKELSSTILYTILEISVIINIILSGILFIIFNNE